MKFFRHATSRVRIALALKGVSVETQPINIFGVEAESRQPDYRRVPALMRMGLPIGIVTGSGKD